MQRFLVPLSQVRILAPQPLLDMAKPLAAVVMAGGIGTRMKSATPKHLHSLVRRPMVDWVVEAARGSGVERIVVVASPSTQELYDGVEVAVQDEARGTGD